MKSKTLFEIDKSISDIAQLSAEAFPPEHIKSIEAKACDPTEGPALWAADGSEKLILLGSIILNLHRTWFIFLKLYWAMYRAGSYPGKEKAPQIDAVTDTATTARMAAGVPQIGGAG
jgi:hypothetical protein